MAALVPITVGVTLAAVSEINFKFLGFSCALLAALANVAHTM
jgi:1,4-dihydroxy-2-naphthoate octaprenyltransferase